jgi:hypothetical protein
MLEMKSKKLVKLLCVNNLIKKIEYEPGTVAHAYKPSYSEGRDQENCSLRPAQAKSETLSHK